MILLSNHDVSKFRLLVEILERSEDKRAMLLSDAVYFINTSETESMIDELLKNGATFMALQNDLTKRGLESTSQKINPIDYEGFVEQLLERRGGIINL